jgi:hypothetical protein
MSIVGRYGKIRENTGRYAKIQEDTGKIRNDAERCGKVRKGAERCGKYNNMEGITTNLYPAALVTIRHRITYQ